MALPASTSSLVNTAVPPKMMTASPFSIGFVAKRPLPAIRDCRTSRRGSSQLTLGYCFICLSRTGRPNCPLYLWFGFLAPRAGFEPASRSNSRRSSVVRVTAVHTLGRLPQAVDRAILPLRIRLDGARARRLAWAEGGGVDAKIKLSSERIRRSSAGLL